MLVEGGGYSVRERTFDGTPEVPDPGWDDPCQEVSLISFYVLTEINVVTTPEISKKSLLDILGIETMDYVELIIVHNILEDCEYALCYKVSYFYDNHKTAYVDAISGKVLKIAEEKMGINAPTEIYGNQNLNDLTVNGITTLTNNFSMRVYDFSNFNDCASRAVNNDFQPNLIPSTTGNQWLLNNAAPSVYQAFYVTDLVQGYLADKDINFDNIDVGVNCTEENAFSFPVQNPLDALIVVGRNTINSLATFDIIGHELGHSYLRNFLNYTNAGNGSLHEGIADMIGTYAESVFQGFVDWEIGDDINISIRNLSNPKYDCFSDVDNLPFALRHDRSTPLGYWFFLITEGSNIEGIPAIGIEVSLDIVLEALFLIGVNADYKDLKTATLTVAELNFGRCSQEFLAVAQAWETICVPTGQANVLGEVYTCDYSVSGPIAVCEEDNSVSFCIQGGLPNSHYRWTIVGGQSTGYTSLQGMQGNIQEGGTCLVLTSFPTYQYYPQIITIKVFSPTTGITVRKVLQIEDCDGDDPNCDDYYYDAFAPQSEYLGVFSNSKAKQDYIINHIVCIYNVYGELLYTGDFHTFDKNTLKTNEIYFIVRMDNNKKIIGTEKYLRVY